MILDKQQVVHRVHINPIKGKVTRLKVYRESGRGLLVK